VTRNDVRRRLALAWWWQVLVTLAPLVLLNALFAAERASSLLAMPLFIAGLASMFVSLPLFHRFKHGLIATEKALDTPEEPAAWVALARIRRLAFVGAALPAWIAALAIFAGLPALPLMLLALSSLVLLYLYRIPRQLG